jgi:hypothetical protein
VKVDALEAEETKLGERLKAGALSSEVAQAALEALGKKRRRMVPRSIAVSAYSAESFSLAAGRYQRVDLAAFLYKSMTYNLVTGGG